MSIIEYIMHEIYPFERETFIDSYVKWGKLF
jgi:hypothetical protein